MFADGFALQFETVDSRQLQSLGDALRSQKITRSRAGLRHAMRVPAVLELATESALVEFASQALGRQAVPFRATLFDKSQAANWLVVWHQDTALPLQSRKEVPGWGPWSIKDGTTYAHAPATALERVVALRIHLDDSTTENGPLRVIPGSHVYGVLTDDQIEGLVHKSKPVECCCPAGSVVLMKPLILHASSKSHSQKPRRVLHIEYADSLDLGGELKLAIA